MVWIAAERDIGREFISFNEIFSCHGDKKARGRFLLQSKVTRRDTFQPPIEIWHSV